MALKNTTKQYQADQALIAGIQKNNSGSSFILQSSPQTAAQVVALLEARVAKANAVFTARAALHQAVLDSRAEDAQTAGLVKDLRQTLLAMYSTSPQTLGDYGLTARKPPKPMTTEEKVIAAAKRLATRKARHTLGKVQKATVTGQLGGPVLVQENGTSQVVQGAGDSTGASAPAAPPASPAPAPAPATPATPTNGATGGAGH
jgi:hypothetical protein